MKVSTRLALGFSFILLLIWTTAFVAGNNYTKIIENFEILEEKIYHFIILTSEIETTIHQITHTTVEYIIHGDAKDKAELIINFERLERGLASHTEHASEMSVNMENVAKQLEEDGLAVISVANEIVSLRDQGLSIDALLKMDDEELDPLIPPFIEYFASHRAEHLEELAVTEEAVQEAYTSGIRLLYLTTGSITILAVASVLVTGKSIIDPLRALQRGTERIAQGNLDFRVGTEAKDEIGQLSRAFDHMTDSLGRTTVSIEILKDEVTAREKAEGKAHQRATQVELLLKVSQRIGSELELDALLQEIVDTVCEIFDYDGAMLLMLDDETDLLKMHSVSGEYAEIFPEGLSVVLGEGMIGNAAAKGKTLFSGDVSQDTYYVRKAGETTNSELSIPIKNGNRVLAVLDIQSAKFNAFDETDISGMETLAEQIAVAIENAQMYRTVQKELLERTKAEEAMRDSEARYRALFENIADAIVVFDQETNRFLDCNRAALDRYGYTLEELRAMTPRQLHPPGELEIVDEHIDDKDQGGPHLYTHTTKDGKRIQVEVHTDEIEYQGSDAWVSVVRDITERMQAQDTLAKREQQLRTITHTALDAIVMIDGEGAISYWNPAAERIFGYSPDEAIGQNLHKLVTPERYRDAQNDGFAKFQKNGQGAAIGQIMELDGVTKDGSNLPIELSLSAMQVGEEWHAVGIMRDIRERKQATEALRASEGRYRQVTESIDQYIYSLEIAPDGSLHSPLVTPSVTHFTGRSHNAHHNDTALWMEHIHPQDRGGVQKELDDLLAEAEGDSQKKVYRVNDIDENTRWVRDDIHVTRDEDGRAIRIDGVVTDITEVNEAQQALKDRNLALQAANERLQEIDQLKSTFLANMSHELRTPLNSIIGFSELMIDGLAGELEDQQVEFIGDIHSSGKHLLALINDLLDISKIEAGKLDLFPEPFRIGELIQETAESIKSLVEQKNQELIFEIPDLLPDLKADRFRIKQVLLNLLSNAHKFTQDGGEIAITVKTIDETALLCSVRDTGIGIATEDMELVFQEFKQVDGTFTREAQGTGLGLPISRRLIELHGGTIWIESVQGKGSTFSFLLPLDGPHDQVPVVFQEHQVDLRLPIESKRLVMIVEDDRRFANLLSFYFNREGFDVAQLFSGEKVLELARLHKPCLISLDLMLPEVDGWQVLKELRSDPETADIPVVILSAIDEHESGGEMWQELGAIDYIVKPLSREDLAKLTARARENIAGASRVLIVDDDDPTGRLMKLVFPLPEFETEYITDPRNALEEIFSNPPDVLVLDLMMPELSGGELLKSLRQDPRTQDLPIVILTAKNLTSKEEDNLGTMVGGIVRKGGREQIDELLRIVRETIKRDEDAGNG